MEPVQIAQFAEASLIIIGFVNGVNFAITKQWDRFFLWLVAVSVGMLLGLLHWFKLPSPEVGLAVAIGSSGIYKLTQNTR